jgi:hypothetical protein
MARGGYTTRKAAFKQIDSAIGNVDTALYHLLNVKNDYTDGHPEIAGAADQIMQHLLKIQEVMKNFRYSF